MDLPDPARTRVAFASTRRCCWYVRVRLIDPIRPQQYREGETLVP